MDPWRTNSDMNTAEVRGFFQDTITRGCAMKIPGKILAALGLPGILLVALSVIVGGESLVKGFLSSNGPSRLKADGASFQRSLEARNRRSSCGPIALKLLFEYYRIECTLEEITDNIDLTPSGASMLSLKEMAEAKGLSSEGWKLTFDDLRRFTVPVIAYVNGNHFVVVDSISKGETAYIRDARGGFVMTKDEFVRGWHGETLVVRK